MEYNLLGISALILIILGLTWLKDREKMEPPLKKRIVIDLVTIAIFWGVFEFYNHSKVEVYKDEISFVVNLTLLFFLGRMGQLICQINPLFKDLFAFLKRKGVNLDIEERNKKNE